mgnify:CR=1 FL=1
MAVLGTDGVSYDDTNMGGSVGNINVPHNSWGNLNNSHYRWVVPTAGWYRLELSVRTRLWGTTGYIKCRIIRNSDSNAPSHFVRMLYENNTGTANVQNTLSWVVDTPAAGDTWYPQFSTSNNSSGSSIQSDSNGYNYCHWQRLG